MQYVELQVVRHAAEILAAVEGAGQNVGCEHEQDVERRPAMFCREHLEEMLGHAPEEQPVFRRVTGPARGEE